MKKRVVILPVFAGLSFATAAKADINYVMAVRNITNQTITIRIEPGKDRSSCITYGKNTVAGVNWDIPPSQARYVPFWRSGDCPGRQGYLAITAFGPSLPTDGNGDDDWQQFQFDSEGGLHKAQNSKYINQLSGQHPLGDRTLFLELRIGCCDQ